MPEQGLAVRKPEAMLAWLRAYAAATSSMASYSHLLNAATPNQSDQPARSTSIAHRDVPTSSRSSNRSPRGSARNPLARLAQSPTRHLADPALATRLLGMTVGGLLHLIIVRDDGKVSAIEVKLATNVRDHDVIHLRWLANHLGDTMLDAIIINTGPHAYRRKDGINVLPFGLLTP